MDSKVFAMRIARQLAECEQGVDRLMAETATLLAEMAAARASCEAFGSGQRAISRMVDAQRSMASVQADLLRVHTDLGSDLVLMRMADACALLDESAGARVHRSWWVARDAVQAVRQHSGRMELALPGNISAPVSRAMQPVLRSQGWL